MYVASIQQPYIHVVICLLFFLLFEDYCTISFSYIQQLLVALSSFHKVAEAAF